jgi:hypothetical protein
VDTDATDDAAPESGWSTSAAEVQSPRPAEGSSPRSQALARRFAEQLVAEAAASAHHDASAPGAPPVDWHAIWASAGGVSSPERAAGRIVLAASHVARTISGIPAVIEGDATPRVGSGTGHPSTGPRSAPLQVADTSAGAAAAATAGAAAGAGAAEVSPGWACLSG